MSDVLKDLSTSKVISAIEGNRDALMTYFSRWPKAEVHEEQDLLWFVTGIPFPMFNGVVRANVRASDVGPRVDEVLAHFKSRNLPMSWHTGPSTQPGNLGTYLEAAGLTKNGTTGMAVDLLALGDGEKVHPRLTIQEVKDNRMLDTYVQTLAAGFEFPELVINVLLDLFRGLAIGQSEALRLWIGFLNDQPVATSQLFLGAGVTGIYNIATIPDVRRQGIGSAMALACLQAAREQEYRIGILHASPMGLNIYKKLGFVEHCQLQTYVWLGNEQQSQAS